MSRGEENVPFDAGCGGSGKTNGGKGKSEKKKVEAGGLSPQEKTRKGKENKKRKKANWQLSSGVPAPFTFFDVGIRGGCGFVWGVLIS